MRLAAVFLIAGIAMLVELYYVATGVLVFDSLMRAMSTIIALEILVAAIILDSTVKFAFAVTGILGVTIFGSMLLYGAIG
jgi:hypothetical protein